MSVADWSALVGAIIAMVGLVSAVMAFFARRIVKDVKDDQRVTDLEHAFNGHVADDSAAFARVDQRLNDGGRQMSDMNEKLVGLDTKVELLVKHFIGRTEPT